MISDDVVDLSILNTYFKYTYLKYCTELPIAITVNKLRECWQTRATSLDVSQSQLA